MSGPASLWDFEGRWRLSRRIVHADGSENGMEGTVTFTRAGPRLVQTEEGELTLAAGTGPIRATRRYVWTEASGRLDLHFEDMRPFHSIPIGERAPETTYLCPPDRYHVTYGFGAWPEWQAVWRVEGPKKDYVMTSRYTPGG